MKSKMIYIKNFSLSVLSACLIAACTPIASAAEVSDDYRTVTAAQDKSTSSDISSSYFASGVSLLEVNGLPSSYSSKDEGYVTAVKNQQYNDCWANSASSAFESILLKSGFSVTEMSVDHANVWATPHADGTGWQRAYTDGATDRVLPGYYTSWQGGVEVSDAGTIDFSLGFDGIATDLAKYGTTELREVDVTSMSSIKQAIMDNGAVVASYSSVSSCYNSARTGYYMPQSYSGSIQGHSIAIVGWNDNYAKSNLTNLNGDTPSEDGAWLVKNSWGSYNSLGGYFWISYEDKYLFGSSFAAPYTIEEVVEITDDMKLFQNEIYGATYDFEYIEDNDLTFINRFDFDSEHRTLDSVIFSCPSIGAEYEVYYIPTEDSEPSGDESTWTLLSSGTVDYSGYIRADADGFILPDGEGSIGVRVVCGEGETSGIGVGEWLVNSGKLVFVNKSEENDSFVYRDGETTELLSWYKENNDDDRGGTFVIKALTLENDDLMTGDTDLNKLVNIFDATLVKKYIVGVSDLSKTQFANADVDGDGTVNIMDVTAIQRIVVSGG